jgi:hypothetical protein
MFQNDFDELLDSQTEGDSLGPRHVSYFQEEHLARFFNFNYMLVSEVI